jgi:hypothetical protein
VWKFATDAEGVNMEERGKVAREVFAIGSEVEISTCGLVGRVLEVCLKSQGEQYRVVWWNGKSRNVEWFESCEVRASDKAKRTPIGFLAD